MLSQPDTIATLPAEQPVLPIRFLHHVATVDHVLHAAQAAGKEGLTLTVQASNVAAQGLYRSLGFRAVGVPYYDLGNVVMTHHFAPVVQEGGMADE